MKQLASHRNIRVLVTIREEDFNRASITGTMVHFSAVHCPLRSRKPESCSRP